MDSEKVGKFIAENRNNKNLTQSQLAEKLHITNKAVSRWERGVGFPDISLLEPLSKELDISILELLKGEYLNKNDQVEKDDINVLLNTLVKINKEQNFQKLFFSTIVICMFFFIISIVYFSFRTYGFDNSYLEQLFNHISLIPFSNLYSLLQSGDIISFLKNIFINFMLSIPITCYIVYLFKNKEKCIKIIIVINVFLEFFKWIMSIGIFDIDDIIIRMMISLIIVKIWQKMKGGEQNEV